MVKKLLIVALFVALLFYFGWFAFHKGNGNATLEFRTEKAKQDIQNTLRKAEDAVHRATTDDTTNPEPVNNP